MIDNERLEGGPSTKKVMDGRRRRTKKEMTKGGKRTEVNYVSEKVKGAEKKRYTNRKGHLRGRYDTGKSEMMQDLRGLTAR